jgi:hypothetical protein
MQAIHCKEQHKEFKEIMPEVFAGSYVKVMGMNFHKF